MKVIRRLQTNNTNEVYNTQLLWPIVDDASYRMMDPSSNACFWGIENRAGDSQTLPF